MCNKKFKFSGTLNGRHYDDMEQFIQAVKSANEDDITQMEYSVEHSFNSNPEEVEPEYIEEPAEEKVYETELVEETEEERVSDEKARRMEEILQGSGLSEKSKERVNNVITEFHQYVSQILEYTHCNEEDLTDFRIESINQNLNYRLNRLRFMISRLDYEERETLSEMIYENVVELSDSVIQDIIDCTDENNDLIDDYTSEMSKIHRENDELYRKYNEESQKNDKKLQDLDRKVYGLHRTNEFYGKLNEIFTDIPGLFEL